MPLTKGTVFIALRVFVRERYREDALQLVLDALSDEDRVTVEVATSSSWYDFEIRVRALRALDSVLGTGDNKLVYDFGAYGAERDLSTAQRMFLHLANPAYVLEKATEYWRRFYDFGEWEVKREHRGAGALLRGNPVNDGVFCAEVTGYIHRMFELVGARDVMVGHPACRGRGDEECVFAGKWR